MKIEKIMEKAGIRETGKAILYIKDGLQEIGLATEELIKEGDRTSITSSTMSMKVTNGVTNGEDWDGADDSSHTTTPPTGWTSFAYVGADDDDSEPTTSHIKYQDDGNIIPFTRGEGYTNVPYPLDGEVGGVDYTYSSEGLSLKSILHLDQTQVAAGSTDGNVGMYQTFTIKNGVKTYISYDMSTMDLGVQFYIKVIAGDEGASDQHLRYNNTSKNLYQNFSGLYFDGSHNYPLDEPPMMNTFLPGAFSNDTGVPQWWSGPAVSWKGEFTYLASEYGESGASRWPETYPEIGDDVEITIVIGFANTISPNDAFQIDNLKIEQHSITDTVASLSDFNLGDKVQLLNSVYNSSDDLSNSSNGYYDIIFSNDSEVWFHEQFISEINSTDVQLLKKGQNYMDIVKDKRYYSLPYDMLKLKDVRILNHLNEDSKYRSIPRMIYEPTEVDGDEI